MTPTAGKWKPISTETLNVAGANIFSGVTVPASAKGAVITFDAEARISIGTNDASSTFGHYWPARTPFFIDCLNQLSQTPDWVTACMPGGVVPPAGFVTFYEVVTNV